MQASDIILLARRTAGLTQDELAARLGRPRSTIARWELAETEPSFRSVREAVAACDRELAVEIFTPDDSYQGHIDQQMRTTPEERVLSLAGPRMLTTVRELAARGTTAVIFGDAAAVLLGWPLSCPDAPVELCPSPSQAIELAELENIELVLTPPGSRGSVDLHRHRESIRTEQGDLQVATPLDLLRIEKARHHPVQAGALKALIDYRHRRPDGPRPARTYSDHEAREVLETWLSR